MVSIGRSSMNMQTSYYLWTDTIRIIIIIIIRIHRLHLIYQFTKVQCRLFDWFIFVRFLGFAM